MDINRHAAIFAFCCIWLITPAAHAGWQDQSPLSINADATPGPVDPHANSGGRRIVRIGDTVIALCADQSGEKTYRSTDNGATWHEIDSNSGYSGSLVTGPDSRVFHFILSGDRLAMIRFQYLGTPEAPRTVHQDSALGETATGVYRAVNATVDADGVLYVAAHWGNPDQVFVFASSDQGESWSGPYQVSAGVGPWYYTHLEVTPANRLVAVYDSFGGEQHSIYFAASTGNGASWTRRLISTEQTFNPALLPVSDDLLLVFAQSMEESHKGMVVNTSTNGGESWSGWRLVDPTCGYADPSPGLGADGRTIYVAYRSSNGTGISAGSCGDRCRSRMAMSSDQGRTWQFVDDHYDAERTGTRSQIRYQTWWNYGGPLEWIWMQYEDGGAQHRTYYDVNSDVTIMNRQDIEPPASDGGSGGGGGGCFVDTIEWEAAPAR